MASVRFICGTQSPHKRLEERLSAFLGTDDTILYGWCFRAWMTELGFTVRPGTHPILAVMFGDATVAGRLAERLLAKGVYVTAFSYPVVPLGLRASGPRCPPRTPATTWNGPRSRSPRRATKSAFRPP